MGTHAWLNWRAFDPEVEAIEDADEELHSDRQFSGGPKTFGPYRLDTVIRGHTGTGKIGEAVILHNAIHHSAIPEIIVDGKLAKSDSSAYHGGTTADEIAALVSLELGVRLRYAGMRQSTGIRYPDRNSNDVVTFEVPRLIRPGRAGSEILPWVMRRPASLEGLQLLASFPSLDEGIQAELIRAARSYGTGIWWANEDPNQAWLQLVTAVETAANCRQTVSADATDLVQEHWPELWADLSEADNAVRVAVCERVAPQMRATRKFVDFVDQCAPPPPDTRDEFKEFDWTRMRKHAGIVYGHRSNALHGGKPFPMPMLEEPRIDASGAIQEAPWGLNSGGLGGIWDAKETPMLLSTFEFVARGALLHWWKELAGAV